MRETRRPRLAHLAAIIVLAFCARLPLAFGPLPAPTNDALEYLTLGKHLRFDHAFSYGAVHRWGQPPDEASGAVHLTANRAPLLPVVIAALWSGTSSNPPLRAIAAMQTLLGVGSVLIICAIALELAPDLVVPTGVVAALWPLSVFSVRGVLSEPLFGMLLLLGTFLWVARRHGLAGVAFGLATLTRASLLPFLIVPVVLSCLPTFRDERRGLCTMALCAVVVVSGWTMRNAAVLGTLVPVATQGWGSNLLLGTVVVPLRSGNPWLIYDRDPEMRAILARGLEDGDAETLMRQAGMRRIWHNPTDWIRARALQYPRLFLDAGEYMYPAAGGATIIKPLMLTASVVLVVLASIGACTLCGRLRRSWTPVLAPVAFFVLVQIPMLADRRYAEPLVPLLILLGLVGWRGLGTWLARARSHAA